MTLEQNWTCRGAYRDRHHISLLTANEFSGVN